FYSSSITNTNNILLKPGINRIKVFAVDYFGNYSDTNEIVVYYFDNTVYVSTSGSDTNVGTIDRPFRSIQKGIDKAMGLGVRNVKISSGLYTPSNGLNTNGVGFYITNVSNINVLGGWSSDFSLSIGLTELDGQGNLNNIVFINNVSNLVFKNFSIRGGKANNPSWGGGILASNVGYSYFDTIYISNNVATNGAGMYVKGDENSFVNVNILSNYAYGSGGGMYIDNSFFYFTNVNILSNYAYGSGGGMYIDNSSFYFTNVNIYLNTAYEGGGIFITNLNYSPSSSDIYDSRVFNNRAYYGGGIFIKNSSNFTSWFEVYNNEAFEGGGVFVSNSTVSFSGNITNNIALRKGGGISMVNSYITSGTSGADVLRNIVSNDSSAYAFGGGMYLSNVSGLFNNLTISSNKVLALSNGYGGGIFIESSSNLTIVGSSVRRIRYNSVYATQVAGGGGIFIKDSTNVVLKGSEFPSYIQNNDIHSSNSAIGGGISIVNSTNVSISNVDISYNSISSSNNGGAGIFVLNSQSVEGIYLSISSNSMSGYMSMGGGYYIVGSEDVILNNVSNFNNTYFGGYIGNTTNVFIAGGQYYLNGGAIYLDKIEGSLVNLTFEDNTNLLSVGGVIIDITNGSYVVISNCTFTNNVGNVAGGIMINNSFSGNSYNLSIVNSSFSGNVATNQSKGGGALYAFNARTLVISNNTFANNFSYGNESKTLVLESTINLAWDDLNIITNIFYGGVGSSPCAIWEEGADSANDIKNHTIKDNVFYLSSYTNLYRDINILTGPGYPGYIESSTNSTNGLPLLNTTPSSYHDATTATGNVGY
ncbi:MAG: hypothetical protein ACP5QP_07675, partial [Brevinematia bacterium]